MPFCPVCRYEYNPGVKKCPDCDAALVDELPEEKKPEAAWADLVSVATYPFEAPAQMDRLRLESQGIESFIANEKMSQSDAILVWADGGVKLFVREEDAGRAREILEEK